MTRPIVVMKFGGTSVRDAERVKRAAERILEIRKAGNRVVVVVSAPGDMTDDLLARAAAITAIPDGREMDMLLATGEQISIALLCMAVKDRGADAISFTGAQAGICAGVTHTNARITAIRPQKLVAELKKGRVVVVAGFQGVNRFDDVVTLGRGGSDLTAVALAARLKAKSCEIFTDVTGVFTADPRLVPDARKIDEISYDAMLELAGAGSQVMQARSIEVAKKFGVVIHVRSSIEHNINGTVISVGRSMEAPAVSGIAYDKNEAKLSVVDVPDRPGVAAELFGALAAKSVNVDMIIQSAGQDNLNDISFTVKREDLPRAQATLARIKTRLRPGGIIVDPGIVKVSIIGVGMKSHPGVAAKMFSILAKAGINIDMISTSEIRVSCAIREKDGPRAVKLLHKAFRLSAKQG